MVFKNAFIILLFTGTLLHAQWTPMGNSPDVPPGSYPAAMETLENGNIVLAWYKENTLNIMKKDLLSHEWRDLYFPYSTDGRFVALTSDRMGNIYGAFNDTSCNNKLTVAVYSEETWSIAGTRGFSPAPVTMTMDLEASLDGTLWLAFRDDSKNGSAHVMFLKENKWHSLPSPVMLPSPLEEKFIQLETDRKGYVYITCTDALTSSDFPHPVTRTVVKKWNGHQWQTLGSDQGAVHSDNYSAYRAVTSASLVISSNDRIYIAYTEWNSFTRTWVKQFNGRTWEHTGNLSEDILNKGEHQLDQAAYPPHLAVTPREELYITVTGSRPDSDRPVFFVMSYINHDRWIQAGDFSQISDQAAPVNILSITPFAQAVTAYITTSGINIKLFP